MSIAGLGIAGYSACVALLVPFLAAISCIFFRAWSKGSYAMYLFLLGVACFASWLYVFNAPTEDLVYVRLSWVQLPGLHLHVGLAHTATTAFLVAIVATVGLVVAFFSVGYLHQIGQTQHLARYYGHVALFLFGMQALLFAPGLFQFFLGWELMGLCSYLLIGFSRDSADGPPAASKAFIYNRIGDAFFIAGLGILLAVAGTTDFKALQDLHQEQALPVFWLAVAGFCWLPAAAGKSAQFPLHGWLPDAMAGPTPVSALIHAATMVVAGLLLLYRMAPLMDMVHLQWAGGMGAITALIGAFQAIQSTKLKQLLAWSTISQLGWMLLIWSMGGTEGSLAHLYAHAFFKAGLFLVAGIILSGAVQVVVNKEAFKKLSIFTMFKSVTFVRLLGIAFLLALSGVPVSAAFLSKELSLQQAIQWWQMHQTHMPWLSTLYLTVAVLTPGMTAWYSMRLFFLIQNALTDSKSSAPTSSFWLMRVAPFVLVPGCTFLLLSWSPLSLHAARGPVSYTPETSFWVLIVSLGLVLVGWGAGYFLQAPIPFFRHGQEETHAVKSRILPEILLARLLVIRGALGLVFTYFHSDQLMKWVGRMSRIAHYVEINVVDRMVVGVAQGKVVIAQMTTWLDISVTDGFLKWIFTGVYHFGPKAAEVQGGRLQSYLVRAVAVLLLGFVILAVILMK
jgi:NADH-quinone oxidoreductase subunit L